MMFVNFPKLLKIYLLLIVCISLSFAILGAFFYRNSNATSWNFGAMGMYTSIDYPGIRYLKIYKKNLLTEEKIHIDTAHIRSSFFKEYESYLSLPSMRNAEKLTKKVGSLHSEEQEELSIILEVWAIAYNSNKHDVSSFIKKQHVVNYNHVK